MPPVVPLVVRASRLPNQAESVFNPSDIGETISFRGGSAVAEAPTKSVSDLDYLTVRWMECTGRRSLEREWMEAMLDGASWGLLLARGGGDPSSCDCMGCGGCAMPPGGVAAAASISYAGLGL